MRTRLMFFLWIINLNVYSQINDSIPVLVRGLKDYRISKSDSLLIAEFASDVDKSNIEKINALPKILKDCNISMKTKLALSNILIGNDNEIDTILFKAIGESLFFIYNSREKFITEDNISHVNDKFYILEKIASKSNISNFCHYVIKNNVIDKCSLYSDDCSYPKDGVNLFTFNEYILSKFADLCSINDLPLIEEISSTTSNNCTFYNLSRLKYYLLKK